MHYPTALPDHIRAALAATYYGDEAQLVDELLATAPLTAAQQQNAQQTATRWITAIRGTKKTLPGIAQMLSYFGLNSREGTALMCLAEAVLRIPDAATADALIQDSFSSTDFVAHLSAHNQEPQANWFLRAAGWTLNLTGKIVAEPDAALSSPSAMMGLLNNRLGHSAVRGAIKHAMGWLGDQFVVGTDIHHALQRAAKAGTSTARFSFDMLGEGARTAQAAEAYFTDYLQTIKATGAANRAQPHLAPSGVSVKLSALHPRYEAAQAERVYTEMVPRVIALAEAAAAENIFMLIDAEEADRLLLSLNVLERVLATAKLGEWQGLGLAVQAYSKRGGAVIAAAACLAETFQRRLIVRLIKGAYWDTEIKRAQERGLPDFPVFTRKLTTDVAYLTCAKQLLAHSTWLAPVFGSHNALTIASIRAMAPQPELLEFQRLQGMGEELFTQLAAEGCRTCIYAPVGNHEILLGYLVRRLLENGANSSFVNQISDPRIAVAELVADPVAKLAALPAKRHPKVTLPQDIYQPKRVNSAGLDLTDPETLHPLQATIDHAVQTGWPAPPATSMADMATAFATAQQAFPAWRDRAVAERAACLNRWADLLQQEQSNLLALLGHEAGKTLIDGVAEVREAVDFCRYYAARALQDCAPIALPSVTGERNVLTLQGRGVFVCISPWNFPLAIFIGQIAAALVMGNAVIAKPAPQTPRIAAQACALAYQAGVPREMLQLVIGDAALGAAMIAQPQVAGVAFTGSVATARAINRALAAKDAPIVPLIAETGGQNALIIDSSALPEQVVDDVLNSAFRSAGQRCSALRLLCLPTAIADTMLELLAAALQEMRLGEPLDPATDSGAVIDSAAHERLMQHVARLQRDETINGTKHLASLPIPAGLQGCFFSPQIWEIPNVNYLTDEVFGPILHVVRYEPAQLDVLIDAINATGFGLTGGVHSRIANTTTHVAARLQVGNVYINRSTIGAVVGSQPFGGMGLSGTGPKAGGSHYLPRFATEKCFSTNTTAAGGNASLIAAAGEG